MTATKGVVDARVHVLHTLQLNGELDPAIAAILDENEPGWRDDRQVTRWFETATAVREWVTRTGLTPDTDDDGATGLRPWLDKQNPVELNAAQRHELESLPGWRSTIDDPAAAPLWQTFVALIDAGTRPTRAHEIDAAIWLAGEWRRLNPGVTLHPVRISGREAATYLDYTLFRARNVREPGHGDPGSRWAGSTWNADGRPELAAAPAKEAGTAWLAAARRCSEWMRTNGGSKPRTAGATAEERYCAGWIKRQRARAVHGLLDAHAATLFATIDARA